VPACSRPAASAVCWPSRIRTTPTTRPIRTARSPASTTATGTWCNLVDLSDGSLAARYEYDPYGNLIGPDTNGDSVFDPATDDSGPCAAQNPIRFSTKSWDDETGFGYWGYRYYSPRLGRWLSRDPAREWGPRVPRQRGPFRPAPSAGSADEVNLYTYTLNRPVAATDLLGLRLSGCCGPDVTDQLERLLRAFEAMFHAADDVEQCRMCFGMISSDGWNIAEFHFAGRSGGYAPFQRGGCGTGTCAGTIVVHGRCYRANEVNYILWGKAHQLCYRAFERWRKIFIWGPLLGRVRTLCGKTVLEAPNPFGLSDALSTVVAWRLTGGALTRGTANRSGAGSISCRLEWTRVGWGAKNVPKSSCQAVGCAAGSCCPRFSGVLSGHVAGKPFFSD